ncbi:MAG: hypothetical protein C4320_01955 [Armatimonadota bacterium]
MAKLLLVEDQADLRKMLPRVLAAKGHQVIPAGTVGEALTALRESLANDDPFHLIISDLSLPDGNGFTVTNEAQRSSGSTVCCFMSGYDSLRASGFDEAFVSNLPLLRKPFTMDELYAFVSQCLDERAKS